MVGFLTRGLKCIESQLLANGVHLGVMKQADTNTGTFTG